MSGDNKNLIITILAIIGGLVVLGWVFKLFANLLGLLIFVGIVVVAVFFVQNVMGKGRR
ncbi:hypothetical protein [Sphingomonas sp. G-3-2-10]|uniref:hypothetical protein n=1 Tax=Sphingomonas sp. G-3-2-10 TaxID=2728838 RepID=UPI001469A068|nr:hypothetical protein [Sphingomonas sp. G-3-2-10]NML05062.1 hypothetical protein [Sphingomonas sp. G-3-2-10]